MRRVGFAAMPPESHCEVASRGENREGSPFVTALVVEDDPLAARQLCEMLAPHEVDVAPHPDAALEALDRRAYDVALVDVYFAGMPGGFRLVSTLHSRRPRPIVVMITAGAGNALEDRAARVGAEALVSKAWLTRDALHELLDRLLAAPRRTPGNRVPLTTRRDRLRPFIENVLAAAQHAQLTIAEKQIRLIALARAAKADPISASAALDYAAEAVGLARSTLSAFCDIGDTYTDEQLTEILGHRVNAEGKPISVYHLQATTGLPAEFAKALLERIYVESLSVTEANAIKKSIKAERLG